MNTTEAPTTTVSSSHRSGLPLSILGVPFDNVTTEQTMDAISQMIASQKPHYVATANVDFTALAMHDEELRRILLEAHMVVCDGMPLVWASRWLGNPLPERVAGSDLVPKLLALAETKGWSVYFLGGQKEVAWRAVQNVRAKHPNLKIAGMMSPEFKPLHEMDHEGICATIREAKPDLLFVSFGCPKQEKWIAMNYQRAGAPVTIGVGATIDFLAGHMKRAPRWMQVSGLEWAYRLAQEPKRLLKRYANDFTVFGGAIGRQWWLTRGSTDEDERTPEPVQVESLTSQLSCVAEITMPERLDAVEVQQVESQWLKRLDEAQDGLILVGADVKFIDSTGLGLLMRLQKRCRETRKHLVLAAASGALMKLLTLTRLHTLLKQAETRDAALLRILGEARAGLPPAGAVEVPVRVEWSGSVTNTECDGLGTGALGILHNAADKGGVVEIDLSGVNKIDAGGLALMLRLLEQASRERTRLRFTNPAAVVRETLRTAHLEDLLAA